MVDFASRVNLFIKCINNHQWVITNKITINNLIEIIKNADNLTGDYEIHDMTSGDNLTGSLDTLLSYSNNDMDFELEMVSI